MSILVFLVVTMRLVYFLKGSCNAITTIVIEIKYTEERAESSYWNIKDAIFHFGS